MAIEKFLSLTSRPHSSYVETIFFSSSLSHRFFLSHRRDHQSRPRRLGSCPRRSSRPCPRQISHPVPVVAWLAELAPAPMAELAPHARGGDRPCTRGADSTQQQPAARGGAYFGARGGRLPVAKLARGGEHACGAYTRQWRRGDRADGGRGVCPWCLRLIRRMGASGQLGENDQALAAAACAAPAWLLPEGRWNRRVSGRGRR